MPRAATKELELARKKKISLSIRRLLATKSFRDKRLYGVARRIREFGLTGGAAMSHEERRKQFKKRFCRICKKTFKPASGRSLTCRACMSARPFCACGCGERVTALGGRGGTRIHQWLSGHHVEGTIRSEETRLRMSRGLKRYAKEHKTEILARARDPDRVEQIVLSLAKRFRMGEPTRPEVIMEEILLALKASYKFQESVGRFIADFIVEDKFVVECDGDYWHSRPARKRLDKLKDLACKKLGYLVLRFSETQLKKDRESVVRTLCEALSKL